MMRLYKLALLTLLIYSLTGFDVMASSRNETQILWSTASSKTVSDANWNQSDAFAFNIEDWEASLQVDADNQGTPASGDILNVKILWTTGDVLTGGGDDYDVDASAALYMALDTYNDADPARKTVSIPTSAKGFKLSVQAPNGATRNVVVKARVITHRPQ